MTTVNDQCRGCDRAVGIPLGAVALDLANDVLTWTCPHCDWIEMKVIAPAVVDVLVELGAPLTFG